MNRVIHFEIQADDIARASEFYKNVLGWKIEQIMKKETGGMDYWGVTTGDSVPGINGGFIPARRRQIVHLRLYGRSSRH